MTFETLSLHPNLLTALSQEGYTVPTEIQAKAIPHVLAGSDVLGLAQTGTGKTAAFALPILHRLYREEKPKGPRKIRALILSPTRELASQIADSFAAYGRNMHLVHTVIFGGVRQGNQTKALQKGIDILVATPGRLLDLMEQGYVDFSALEVLVLDEADRMLDMGFMPDVRAILRQVPNTRQTLFFSATMPPVAQSLADSILRKPVRVEVTPVASTVDKIEQFVFFVEKDRKRELLVHLLGKEEVKRVLVFVRTKHGADRVQRHLDYAGVKAEAIHGDKSQSQREKALAAFKKGKARVLLATDIAARGIDVDDVTHVINFDLPEEAEAYVHRIGRTARAGASGVAWAFCDMLERVLLRQIERLTKRHLTVVEDHPCKSHISAEPPAPKHMAPSIGQGRGRRRATTMGRKSGW